MPRPLHYKQKNRNKTAREDLDREATISTPMPTKEEYKEISKLIKEGTSNHQGHPRVMHLKRCARLIANYKGEYKCPKCEEEGNQTKTKERK